MGQKQRRNKVGQKQRHNNVFSETKLGRWALDVNVHDIRVARLCEVDELEDSAGEKLCQRFCETGI